MTGRTESEVHIGHPGDCSENCGPWEGAVILRRTMTQNQRGEWVPSIPLPLFRWPHRHQCACKRAFWTMDGYRGHYAAAHMIDGGTP